MFQCGNVNSDVFSVAFNGNPAEKFSVVLQDIPINPPDTPEPPRATCNRDYEPYTLAQRKFSSVKEKVDEDCKKCMGNIGMNGTKRKF